MTVVSDRATGGECIIARALNMRLRPFIRISATTSSGLLSSSPCDHLQIREHRDRYSQSEIEPFLLRAKLVGRTLRGRKLTAKGYKHLGQTPPEA